MKAMATDKSRNVAWLAAGVIAVAAAVALSKRKASAPAPRPPAAFDALGYAGDASVVPAQEAADDGLALGLRVERAPGARKLTLTLSGGSALLVLEDARDRGTKDLPMAFGDGTITAANRDAGSAFLKAIANWLDAPVPAPREEQTPLEPVRITYVRLGTTEAGKPEAMKLFLQSRKLEAEVYLNVMSDGTRATLLEKDEDYRKDLIAFLAMALRDGPPLRRSAKNDPELASDEPLLGHVVPLPGKAGHFCFAADGTLLGSTEHALLQWPDPSKEPVVAATFDAEVFDLKPAPRGSGVAVTLTQTENPGSYSIRDPEWVVLWDRATRTKTEIVSKTERGAAEGWSPDAKKVVIAQRTSGKPPLKSTVRIYDIDARALGDSTDSAFDADFEAWTEAGILLHHADYSSDDHSGEHWYLWQGGHAPPVMTVQPAAAFASPDAAFHVVVDAEAIVARSKSGANQKFVPKRDEDKDAIEILRDEPPRFIGPHGLFFPAEEPFVLDLDSLRLRRLTDQPDVTPAVTSPDGRRIVLSGKHGATLYAEIR